MAKKVKLKFTKDGKLKFVGFYGGYWNESLQ